MDCACLLCIHCTSLRKKKPFLNIALDCLQNIFTPIPSSLSPFSPFHPYSLHLIISTTLGSRKIGLLRNEDTGGGSERGHHHQGPPACARAWTRAQVLGSHIQSSSHNALLSELHPPSCSGLAEMSGGSATVRLHIAHHTYPFYVLEFCLRFHLNSLRIADITDAKTNIVIQGLFSSFAPCVV